MYVPQGGGLKGFVVTAPESLTTILTGFGLSTEMDFINDETVITTIESVHRLISISHLL